MILFLLNIDNGTNDPLSDKHGFLGFLLFVFKITDVYLVPLFFLFFSRKLNNSSILKNKLTTVYKWEKYKIKMEDHSYGCVQ